MRSTIKLPFTLCACGAAKPGRRPKEASGAPYVCAACRPGAPRLEVYADAEALLKTLREAAAAAGKCWPIWTTGEVWSLCPAQWRKARDRRRMHKTLAHIRGHGQAKRLGRGLYDFT